MNHIDGPEPADLHRFRRQLALRAAIAMKPDVYELLQVRAGLTG
jgi:hypothetical protein